MFRVAGIMFRTACLDVWIQTFVTVVGIVSYIIHSMLGSSSIIAIIKGNTSVRSTLDNFDASAITSHLGVAHLQLRQFHHVECNCTSDLLIRRMRCLARSRAYRRTDSCTGRTTAMVQTATAQTTTVASTTVAQQQRQQQQQRVQR